MSTFRRGALFLLFFPIFLVVFSFFLVCTIGERVFAQIPHITPSFHFDLTIGDSSLSVLQLQKILNSDPDTLVAEYGPGSLGNETNYFGEKTRAAVIRFQNKHSLEILAPLGLQAGTGRVGSRTRSLLNRLSPSVPSTPPAPAVSPKQIESTGTGTASPDPLGSVTRVSPTDETLTLAYPHSYTVSPGASLTLFGSGFSLTKNTVRVGSSAFEVAAQNTSTLVFKIPKDFALGRYDISVSNEKGTAAQKTFIVVTDGKSSPPMIERVDPSSGGLSATIKIVGKNFTPTGNEVRTNFGIISNLSSSDGTTLSFSLNLPNAQDMEKALERVSGAAWPVYLYVVNAHGVTPRDGQGVYTIKK